MTAIVPLSRKAIWLLLQAIDDRIASEQQRYANEDAADDEAGDFGNDLHYLKGVRDEFAKIRDKDSWHAKIFECWEDPEDGSVSLLKYGDSELHKAKALLSNRAKVLYTFPAATQDEAMAIHYLRQGLGAYVPTGEYSRCASCGAQSYRLSNAVCWRCGA